MMSIRHTSRARAGKALKAVSRLCLLALGLLAGCTNDFGVLTKADQQSLLIAARCIMYEPTASFTTLVDGAEVCDGLTIVFNDTNPRDTEHRVSIDNDTWVTAESGVTTFSAIPGFGSLSTGAAITLYLKGESLCNSTQVNLVKAGPTVAITQPAEGALLFGTEKISFTDSVTTTHLASIDQTNWVAAVSGVTTVNDCTGFSAIADGVSFILYVRGNNTVCNTVGIIARKGAPADFLGSKTVTLDTTVGTGAGVANNVDNFPVLLRYPSPNSILDDTRPDAHDIRFRLSNGTWLDYEIELWDPLLDGFAIWVLVPTVYGNNKTQTITIYYGEAVTDSIPDGQKPDSVFSVSNGFAGVWHMSDNPATGPIRDSTSNHFDGTPHGMTIGDRITYDPTGGIGGFYNFDGTDNWISLGAHTELQPANITLSFWIKRTTNWSSAWVPIYAKVSGYSSNGWQFYMVPNGADSIAASLYVDGNNYFYVNIDPNTYYALNTWVFLTLSFNTTTNTGEIYTNGATQTILTQGSCNTITADVATITKIAQDDGSSCWPGQMDELRISNVVRSADWIKLNYENQKSGQKLVWW